LSIQAANHLAGLGHERRVKGKVRRRKKREDVTKKREASGGMFDFLNEKVNAGKKKENTQSLSTRSLFALSEKEANEKWKESNVRVTAMKKKLEKLEGSLERNKTRDKTVASQLEKKIIHLRKTIAHEEQEGGNLRNKMNSNVLLKKKKYDKKNVF